VVIHGDLQPRNRHPKLAIAKAGDAAAALALVRDLLSEVAIRRLRGLLQGRQPFVVPVTAIEVAGFNAIPDAMAQEIGERMGPHTAFGHDHPVEQGCPYESGRLAPPGHTGDVHWNRHCWRRLPARRRHIGFGGTLAMSLE
jgi:hypothetical protein